MVEAQDTKSDQAGYPNSLILRRMVAYMRPYAKQVVLTFCMLLLMSFISQLSPWLTKIAIDDHITKGDVAGLDWIAAVFAISIVAQYVLRSCQIVITETTGQRIMADIRSEVFAHLQELPVAYFDRASAGDIVTRTSDDIETLINFYILGVADILFNFLVVLAIVTIMASMDVELALTVCTAVPALFAAVFYFQGRISQSYRSMRTHLSALNKQLRENVKGIKVVKLFNRQRLALDNFRREHQSYRNSKDRDVAYSSVLFPLVELLSTMSVVLLVWKGGDMAFSGQISLGILVSFFQYINRMYRPIMGLNSSYGVMRKAAVSATRIFELLDIPKERQKAGPRWEPRRNGGDCVIEFRNVYFKYDLDDEGYTLRDVSFEMKPGQSLALVGATGSGKSTIINLLLRFYEIEKGSIMLYGRDIREWDADDLRRRIRVVLQDPFLMSGDIQGNIAFGDRSATEAQVRVAAEKAHAADFIESLPRGFGHEVVEGGHAFSSGERQLISLARALVGESDILVLDEATSNIDPQTERNIQEAVGRLMGKRTSIFITHRLSTVRDVDQILVFGNGTICERGKHGDLMRNNGPYAELYRSNSLR